LAAAVSAAFVLAAIPALAGDERGKSADAPEIPPHVSPEKGFWRTIGDFFLPHRPATKTLLRKETEFHVITVEDDELGYRRLVFQPDHGAQGVIIPEKPDVVVPNFMKYGFLSLPALTKQPKKALFIGLGAGIMPRFLSKRRPDMDIDVVEIDPGVLEIAGKFFGFATSKRLKVRIEDGRVFVDRKKGGKYDIVFLDAFNATGIPFHLTTVEFYRGVRGKLDENGVFAANIANLGRKEFLADELATVASVFKHVAVVECPNVSNWVLFASDKPLFDEKKWRSKAEAFDRKNKWDFKLAPYLDSIFPKDKIDALKKKGRILTDDFAPVD
jgi:spermidine synthase